MVYQSPELTVQGTRLGGGGGGAPLSLSEVVRLRHLVGHRKVAGLCLNLPMDNNNTPVVSSANTYDSLPRAIILHILTHLILT